MKHWQDEFKELENTLQEINVQNLGKLNEDLKRRQDISSNIAEFLDVVSDMNNPKIEDVCAIIEEKLTQKGFLEGGRSRDESDLFATLGIQRTKYGCEPTDLEINQFIRNSFERIVDLFSQLCYQYQEKNAWMQVQIEKVDTKTVIYQFYRNGKLVRGLRLFLSNMFGGRENIGLSDNIMSIGSGSSWNAMYEAKYMDGELTLYATMSLMNNQKAMRVEDVVADIWKHYIQIYLDR